MFYLFILICFYQVDLLFKDASIGNAISLAVVHIWILKDKEFGGSKSDGKCFFFNLFMLINKNTVYVSLHFQYSL